MPTPLARFTIAPPSTHVEGRPPRWRRVAGAMVVGAMLGLYAVMAISGARNNGPGFDEPGHLAAGYNMWLKRDFRLDPANGDLPKRWAALPLIFEDVMFASDEDPAWRHGEVQLVGFKFLFGGTNNPASLLRQGRFMITLLGVVLGWLVYRAAARLFGMPGGLVALTAYVFSPDMLAHGALITTDLAAALLLFGATLAWWRWLERPTWRRGLLSLLACGLLFGTKLSAVILLPVAAILAVVRCVARSERRPGVRAIFGMAALHAAAAILVLWALYDFRFDARSGPPAKELIFQSAPGQDLAPGALNSRLVHFALAHHLLPEGYLHGVSVLAASTGHRIAFMNGNWRMGGWRGYFPYTFLVKTPPALLALVALGLAAWSWLRVCGREAPDPVGAAPWVTLVLVYGTAAVAQNLNIGHRHILPVYPPLFVLAGSAALLLRFGRWSRAVVAGLGAWLVADTLAIRPHYLAYFNALAGGPIHAYRHLVDSSLDWGMDLPELSAWLKSYNAGGKAPVYLAYFGTGSPEFYGVESHRLPGFFDWRPHEAYPLRPGIYAISATLLEGVYTQCPGPWCPQSETEYQKAMDDTMRWGRSADSPAERGRLLSEHPESYWNGAGEAFEQLRFGRLCAWLRNQRSPDGMAGYSILIWKLDALMLREALLGPPVEMRDLRTDETVRFAE